MGTRVEVLNGNQSKKLGEGTYVGDVLAYFIAMPDGSISSLYDAKQKPPPEIVPEGAEVVGVADNPKIELDSGEVVYGCQVWWQPVGGWKTLEELENGPQEDDGNRETQ